MLLAARGRRRLTVAVLTPACREELHRRGLLLEWFTVAWNVVEAFVAIGVGVLVGSVALVGFGVSWATERAEPHP